jgi:hypothetical protein
MTSLDGVDFGSPWQKRGFVTLDGLTVPAIGYDALCLYKKTMGCWRDQIDYDFLIYHPNMGDLRHPDETQ